MKGSLERGAQLDTNRTMTAARVMESAERTTPTMSRPAVAAPRASDVKSPRGRPASELGLTEEQLKELQRCTAPLADDWDGDDNFPADE